MAALAAQARLNMDGLFYRNFHQIGIRVRHMRIESGQVVDDMSRFPSGTAQSFLIKVLINYRLPVYPARIGGATPTEMEETVFTNWPERRALASLSHRQKENFGITIRWSFRAAEDAEAHNNGSRAEVSNSNAPDEPYNPPTSEAPTPSA